MRTTAGLLLLLVVVVNAQSQWSVWYDNWGRRIEYRYEYINGRYVYVENTPATTTTTTTAAPPSAPYIWVYRGGRWVQEYQQNQQDDQAWNSMLEQSTDCQSMEFIKEDFMHKRGIMRHLTGNTERCLLGDMIVSQYPVRMIKNQVQSNSGRRKRTAINFETFPDQKWNNGIINYFFDPNYPHSDVEKGLIRDAMNLWTDRTCIRFQEVPTTSSEPRINITSKSTGCLAFVGKSEAQPQGLLLSSSQCFLDGPGTAAHEIAHIIGLWHEVQRPDRDSSVTINMDNLQEEESGNFLTLPQFAVDTHGAPYDFSSIMHYQAYVFIKDNTNSRVISTKNPLYQKSIGQRVQPSYYDVFKVNQAYCQERCAGVSVQCVRGHQNPKSCSSCICPDGFSGALCDSVAPSQPSPGLCGGELVAGFDPQYIQSPGYPSRYDNRLQCAWRIRANPGFEVRVNFEGQFGVYENDKDTCFHWVEIKYHNLTNSGPRFCSSVLPTATLTSRGNEMVVLFNSVYDYTSGASADLTRGFRLQYQTTEPNPCGRGPCDNGGTCTPDSSALGGFTCSCTPQWTGTTCTEEVECPSTADCQNGGSCMPSADLTRYPRGYYCDCMTGFLGDNCQIDICTGLCGGDRGRCIRLVIDGSPSPRCECLPQYTGQNCETDICPPGACSGSGRCVPGSPPGSTNHPADYYCDCFSTFVPNQDQTDCSDPCAAGMNPCENGGTCVRLGLANNPTMCICPPGYNQPTCEAPADPCNSRPCQNGGSCTSNLSAFSCTCRGGFTGRLCEIRPDPCASTPCMNDGVCIGNILTGSYQCTCLNGYSDSNCQTAPVNTCLQRPCQNGGICINHRSTGVYTCLCFNSYTGNNCQTAPENPCMDRPCQNGGICISNIAQGTYRCSCRNGYSGSRCQTAPENPCMDRPCQNGGICISNIAQGTYRCSCRNGYSGLSCQTAPRDPCMSAPCRNGGVCTGDAARGTYRCQCRGGYTGSICQTAPSPCSSNPCQNGGTCRRSSSGFSCSCVTGYQGTTCASMAVTPGPTEDQCESRTCGGWSLTPGQHSRDVCPGQKVMRSREVKTCTRGGRSGWSWGRRQCSYETVEEEVQLHVCCNGALNVTAQKLGRDRNVPICVKPGWETDFRPCPATSLGYCGGCGVQTRGLWALTMRADNCKEFRRIQVEKRQCTSRVCESCSWWNEFCGLCTSEDCCANAVRNGDMCEPEGTRTRTYGNPAAAPSPAPAPGPGPDPTRVPIVTVDPTGLFLPQVDDGEPPIVSNPIWRGP